MIYISVRHLCPMLGEAGREHQIPWDWSCPQRLVVIIPPTLCCWELNLHLLEEQPELLTFEPSLQTLQLWVKSQWSA